MRGDSIEHLDPVSSFVGEVKESATGDGVKRSDGMLEFQYLVIREAMDVCGREAEQLRHLMQKERPREAARAAAGRMPVAKFVPKRAEQRAEFTAAVAMTELLGRPFGGGAIEHQPQSKEVDDVHGQGLHRSAIGAILELADHAGPAAEGHERLGNVVRPDRFRHAELLQLVLDHLEGNAAARSSGVVRGAKAPEPGRQSLAPGLHGAQSPRIHAGDRGQHALVSVGHGPRRDALVEIGGHHPDQERMDCGVSVERRPNGENQVAVPDWWPDVHDSRPVARSHLDAGVPEFAGDLAIAASIRFRSVDGGFQQSGPDVRLEVVTQPLDRFAFGERPTHRRIALEFHAVQQQLPMQLDKRGVAASERSCGAITEIRGEYGLHV